MGQPGDPSNLGNGTRTNNKCAYYFTTVVTAKKSKNRSGRWTVNFLAHLLPQFITVEPAPPPSRIPAAMASSVGAGNVGVGAVIAATARWGLPRATIYDPVKVGERF